MSSKRCSRCEKTVYPLEELKCLDKLWHKQCFKCQECGMTLNMKTYKGYNKQPYCNAHCPQAKHTAVADTPEIRRLAENTKLQSNVKYHEDFEKAKGKFTQVADDPETLRIRNTSKIISNVSYHGELERKKQMEQKRHLVPEKNGVSVPLNGGNDISSSPDLIEYSAPPQIASSQPPPQPPQGRIVDYEPPVAPEPLHKDSPYSAKLTSTVIYTSQEGPVHQPPSRKIGSIADYDPLNENYGSLASGYRTGMPHDASNLFRAQEPVPSVPKAAFRTFRAMYDYVAQDSDEVSFSDGDTIIECHAIDDGWMTGTVQRTGQSGMLPANYVEPLN
ncbi:LIM and SH3 domain protein F42H10.3-like isoform X2 [Uloborus diversus]|uniref:LIM and SH3 domain protein F42H10.3-like isoform X2 n=1 Tax=Uloborus diversus TaxID=327109 RepID=UPI00240A15DD|nr:LIM and SH3 domain protein F42H10.3-like isoform X2 [Uloborus diversus]